MTAPAISPVPSDDPCKVKVLLPGPVAVVALLNFSNPPMPACSSVPPPVKPARLITRSVVSPAAPVKINLPGVPPLPRSMVPLAAVVGRPRLLLATPPTTLLSEPTLTAPLRMVVLPEKVLAPASVKVLVPAFTSASTPPEFCSWPAKLLSAPLVPIVTVEVPALVSTVPLPVSAVIVMLKPFRSSVAPAPSARSPPKPGKALATPSLRVPAMLVVPL